ncbi:keratin 98 [Xyrauchen texanus]|uniref:keratin 98 n=1 Tax=Xyrauchen texanus TaxID=154827 RepID=UPI002241D862|nr:keratin 98 [Xyrauchen texanus]
MSLPSRALSVHGGAGGRGNRISSFTDLSADQKTTMQSLNNRLDSYLLKVHSLEETNAEMEKKILEWYESRTDVTFDHTNFLAVIEDLRGKIHCMFKNNIKIILDIDNAKLVTNDLKIKYEKELATHRDIEADVGNLRKFIDELSLNRSDLEVQYESLKEELIILTRNHEEEMALALTEAGSQVNVCVDAVPSMDLNQAITETRDNYEAVAEKKQRELESWCQSRITTVQQEMVTQNEELQVSRTELKELTSKFQRLQIELQSLHSMRTLLEGTLEEKQAFYSTLLGGLQLTVNNQEDQLSQVHARIGSNSQEYDTLLDIKTQLENEIAEYRRLLDGEESKTHKIITKTTTVVETIVNDRVVESSETLDVDVQAD